MSEIKIRVGGSKDNSPKESPFVVKAIIVDHDGRVLMVRRTSTAPSFPNLWDLPGGHIHVGESKVSGLYREVKEETDILIAQSETRPIANMGTQTFYYVPKWNVYGGIKLSFEHDEYAWVDIDTELEQYPCGPNYMKVLSYIAKLL